MRVLKSKVFLLFNRKTPWPLNIKNTHFSLIESVLASFIELSWSQKYLSIYLLYETIQLPSTKYQHRTMRTQWEPRSLTMQMVTVEYLHNRAARKVSRLHKQERTLGQYCRAGWRVTFAQCSVCACIHPSRRAQNTPDTLHEGDFNRQAAEVCDSHALQLDSKSGQRFPPPLNIRWFKFGLSYRW